MPENQNESSNRASKKEGGKDPTLSDIVEDLSSYLKKFSHFEKYEKDIKRKYQKYYSKTLPDRWPVDFINKAWRKTTKHMYTFSDRRKCWSLAILLQVMKRSQGYDESQREEAESDPKEDNQQSGGDPSANKSVYIRIPFTEMIDNQTEMIDNQKYKAPETDKNATKTDENASVKSANENPYKLIDKVPSPTQILQNNFYITLYDNRTRNAAWVYEILNKSPKSDKKVSRKNIYFKDNTLVHPLFRPSMDTDNDPYENTGYNRGHLAAAANHKWCQEACNDTFYITNAVPQQSDFNNEYWSDLEELCRKIAQQEEVRNVHVYTGPLYLLDNNDQNKSEKRVEYKFLGGKAVPTHLFKVIIVENNDSKVLEPECYRIPNSKLLYIKIKSRDKPNKIMDLRSTLHKFIKPIKEIQENSGLIFEEKEIREEMEDGTWKVHRRKNPAEKGKETKIEVTVSGSYHSDRAVL
ncbi:uncharacterized protein [Chanodichthys erythropterus]|uniref:uncharacterized protein isoform X1 n=1 Tax=Chanodichthys erythropterus TaxID=933992 RepID=UPI00351EE1CA